MNEKGYVTMVKGQIVEVEFIDNKPALNDILYIENNKDLLLEVFASSTGNRFYCLALKNNCNLKRGDAVINTNKSLTVPVTPKVLGRVFDVFGDDHDGKGNLHNEPQMEVFHKKDDLKSDQIHVYNELLHTGIKCIDFFCPIIRGGRAGLFGGAGVGKTILLTELINNIVIAKTASENEDNESNKEVKTESETVSGNVEKDELGEIKKAQPEEGGNGKPEGEGRGKSNEGGINDAQKIKENLERQLYSGPFGEYVFADFLKENPQYNKYKDAYKDNSTSLPSQKNEKSDQSFNEGLKDTQNSISQSESSIIFDNGNNQTGNNKDVSLSIQSLSISTNNISGNTNNNDNNNDYNNSNNNNNSTNNNEEIITDHNLVETEIPDDYYYLKSVKAVSVFAAVGERSREAQELVETLYETKVMPYVSLVLGQMGENPAVRFRTAYSAAALAEYFRDALKKNVLFFMDNVYRFAQAGYELSTLMNLLPSEDGYQPTLNSELGSFHERLVSTKDASVTVIEAVFVPSDDVTDYGVRSIFPFLNTSVVFSREVYQQGRFPAIDFLQSNSSALNPDVIGDKHYNAYLDAKSLLEKSSKIERIASLVGEHELSTEDQTIFKRTKILRNYMTQSFHVVESQTGQKGTTMLIDDVVSDVERILKGEFDEVDPREFLYIGKIDDIKEKINNNENSENK